MELSVGEERKLERIDHLLDSLASELSRGIPVIVEGRRDVKALESLNVKGMIIPAKANGRSMLSLIQEIERYGWNEVILLMDFDRRGVELTMRLKRYLESIKVKPNISFWKELSSLLRRDLKDIEGLSSYIKNLRLRARVGIV